MKREKKETINFHFSYLDVFFLLLAGCLFSVWIYFFAEDTTREEVVPLYHVEAVATYREELFDTIPEVGETVFDAEGKPVGKILYVDGENGDVRMLFSMEKEAVEKGERILLETKDSVKEVEVINVTKKTKGEES